MWLCALASASARKELDGIVGTTVDKEATLTIRAVTAGKIRLITLGAALHQEYLVYGSARS